MRYRKKVCIMALSLMSAISAAQAETSLCIHKKRGIVRLASACKRTELKVLVPDAAAPEKLFKYKVGDIGPAGGWIFYVDRLDQYPEFDYIEAAPTDANNGVAVPWATVTTGCYGANDAMVNCQEGSVYPGYLQAAKQQENRKLGLGKSNTSYIVDLFTKAGAQQGEYAAGVARDYSMNGYSDWYLPSQGEAMMMYENLLMAGVGDMRREAYWSSSEYSGNYVWYQNFNSGVQDGSVKGPAMLRVRPVRSFQ